MSLLPELSFTERTRRWTLVRELMALRGLEALLVWGGSAKLGSKSANTRYLTNIGGSVEEALVVFSLERDPICYVWHPARVHWWLKVQSWAKDIRGRKGTWARSAADALRELNLTSGRIGVVGLRAAVNVEGDIPYATYRGLEELLPQADLENASDLLEFARAIKSEEELGFLGRAAAIGDIMVQAFIEAAKPGAYHDEVYGRVIESMIRNEGEYPTMILWDAGEYPSPHPGRGPWHERLSRGDIINTEFHSQYGGYLAHVERSFSLGEPKPQFGRIFDVSLESYHGGLSAICDGARIGEVEKAFRDPIRKAGLVFTECGLHGHGIDTGEYPMFVFPPEQESWGTRGETLVLRAGMVLGVVIDLRDAKWRDDTGLMLGDTIHVTKDGCERLCRYPLEFHRTC